MTAIHVIEAIAIEAIALALVMYGLWPPRKRKEDRYSVLADLQKYQDEQDRKNEVE
jgi:hypothetical protein